MDHPPEITEQHKQRADDLSLYRHFMVAIKLRLDFTRKLLLERETFPLPDFALAELFLLQYRMICELIAIACLSLQRELPGARGSDISKFYQADKILDALEKLHPDFYPQPIAPENEQAILEGYLTKPELKQLYLFCSKYLHQGTVKKPHAIPPESGPIDISPELFNAQHKLELLLNYHGIQMPEPGWVVTVKMASSLHNGEVFAAMDMRIPRA